MDEINENQASEVLTPEAPKKEKISLIVSLYDWLEVACVAAVLVILIFTFIGRMATVSGGSMDNTLSHGDRLLITNLFYTPERYDIVVVQKEDGYYEDELLVKRVIAKGGETITFDFENWTVSVNGKKLYEPYVKKNPYESMRRDDVAGYTVVVPEGYYFVMGDNRNGSTDSRSALVGFVKESEIIGKAVFRVAPFSSFGTLDSIFEN